MPQATFFELGVFFPADSRLDYQPLFGKWARAEEQRPDSRERPKSSLRRFMITLFCVPSPYQNDTEQLLVTRKAKALVVITCVGKLISKSDTITKLIAVYLSVFEFKNYTCVV